MRKLLLVLSGLCMVTGAFAADETTEFKWDSEFRTRFVTDNSATLNPVTGDPTSLTSTTGNATNDFYSRIKLDAKMTRGEKLTGYVSILGNIRWGATVAGGEVPGVPGATVADKDYMWVYQAWGWWKNSENLSFKFGRIAMNVADGSLIGYNDWAATPYAFEGVGAILDYDFGRIMIAGVKGANLPATPGNSDPAAVFYGVSYDAKNMPDWFKMANLTVIQVNTDQITGAAGASELRVGVTLGGEMSNVDFKAGYYLDSGKTLAATSHNISSNMIQANVGYRMPEVMNFHVGLNYHTDTGNDPSSQDIKQYNPFFYSQHGTGGLMDMFTWGNLTYVKADVSIDPWETTTFGLAYTMYTRTNSKSQVNGVGQIAVDGGGNLLDTSDAALGNELDIYANYKVSNDFKLHTFYGMFTPGAALTNNGAISLTNDNRWVVQGIMNF